MNKAMLTVGIILLSVISLLLLNVLSDYSTGSELDYYLVKETTNAAMSDAVDMAYYRVCGMHRIDKEKFVESFLYRFADSVDISKSYTVGFYDINELPPKVSVKVDSLTTLSFKGTAADITTSYDAILEDNYIDDEVVSTGLRDNSDLCKSYYQLANE